MPDNFYDSGSEDDSQSAPPSAESDESPKSKDKREDKDDDGQTALLPKSMFGGHKCKVGDVKRFEIVHDFEGEYEVKYVGKDTKDKSESKDEDSEDMKDSMDQLDEAYA